MSLCSDLDSAANYRIPTSKAMSARDLHLKMSDISLCFNNGKSAPRIQESGEDFATIDEQMRGMAMWY